MYKCHKSQELCIGHSNSLTWPPACQLSVVNNIECNMSTKANTQRLNTKEMSLKKRINKWKITEVSNLVKIKVKRTINIQCHKLQEFCVGLSTTFLLFAASSPMSPQFLLLLLLQLQFFHLSAWSFIMAMGEETLHHLLKGL